MTEMPTDKRPDDVYVRVATPDDLDGIMRLAHLVWNENGVHDLDNGKVLQQLWPALVRDNAICGVIGPVGGELTGVILLRVATTWYGTSRHLEEMVVFTSPDHRTKGRRASKLCEFAKKAADELGLPLHISVLSSHRTETKVKLYERKFGEPAGAFFLYQAKTGDHTPTCVKG